MYTQDEIDSAIIDYIREENRAREKRAKWIIPGFDPKKHKIILQGENKMAKEEEVTGTNTSSAGSPTYFNYVGLQVKIEKVSNGFIVEIGCKKFVAEDWKSLASKLGEYWKDPVAAEEKYAK